MDIYVQELALPAGIEYEIHSNECIFDEANLCNRFISIQLKLEFMAFN